MRPALFLLPLLLVASQQAGAADAYVQSIEQWHAKRVESLKKPDGWFSYAGSGIVNSGTSIIGSANDSDIVLPKGPARLGTLNLDGSMVATFEAAPRSGALIDGKAVEGKVVLKDNADDGTPTRVYWGDTWFYLVRMDDVIGWRFRDPDSPARKAFTGIDTFPIDARWRIEADWEAYETPREIELITIINTIQKSPVPGKATFAVEGKSFELQPVLEDDGTLFFIFADQTSGKETYGAARFLYADAPSDGKVVIDFNKAYNPPCALSPHVVCPTAPAWNRLRLRVTAGEKTYRGTTHP
jgi:uncharacterized protein (DUF1684 family)